MAIPILDQVYDEVRRLSIAGSAVAPGDFRLKKMVAPLAQAGQKAPVLAKVAEAVGRVVESDEKSSAAALLELTGMVNAILYTQGQTGIEGEMVPLPATGIGRPHSTTSARLLKSVREALSTTGPGRLEVVRDAFERGAFQDFRLIRPALGALDDRFAELADFVEGKVVPLYGPAVFGKLETTFDPKGRAGDARRLHLMHQLDPARARPHVLRSLEEGTAEVRLEALACLGDVPDDLALLLEQGRAKSKEVRAAALKALARTGSDEAARILGAALAEADLEPAVEALRTSRHPAVTHLLLDEAEKQFNGLLAGKEKDAKKLGKLNSRTMQLLECLRGRDDPRTEQFLLTMFAKADKLAAVPGEPSGKDALEYLFTVMADGPARGQAVLADSHATLPVEHLDQVFVAACRCRTPEEVFDLFSPYLTKGGERKKKRDPANARREAMLKVLRLGHGHLRSDPGTDDADEPKLDSRWLDLAIDLGLADLVGTLAVPGHAKANAFLAEQFRQRSEKSANPLEAIVILETMIRLNHPEATDAAVESIRKTAGGKGAPSQYWISHLVGRLPPAEAVPKLEALLPTLPETLVDQVLECLAALKSAAP